MFIIPLTLKHHHRIVKFLKRIQILKNMNVEDVNLDGLVLPIQLPQLIFYAAFRYKTVINLFILEDFLNFLDRI